MSGFKSGNEILLNATQANSVSYCSYYFLYFLLINMIIKINIFFSVNLFCELD